MTTAKFRGEILTLRSAGREWRMNFNDLIDARLTASLNDYLETCSPSEAETIIKAIGDAIEAEVRKRLYNARLAELLAAEMPDAAISITDAHPHILLGRDDD